MPRRPNIESMMTPYPFAVESDAQIATARTMMDQLGIRHLPVRDGNRLVGVVSDQTLRQAEKCGMDISVSSSLRVRDVCNPQVHIVAPDQLLEDVLREMAAKHSDVALVVRDDKLLGIFTGTDACRGYAELLHKQP